MRINIISILVLLTNFAFAQKKPIDHSVYDDWKSIKQAGISDNGSFIFYNISPQDGDSFSQVKNSNNEIILNIPRGVDIRMSKDENFLFATIKPKQSEVKEAVRKKKKPHEMPKDTLLIYNIKTKGEQKIVDAKNFQRDGNGDGDNYITLLGETLKPSPKSSTDSTKKEIKIPTAYLINLNKNDTIKFEHAENFFISRKDKYFIFSRKDSTEDAGLYIYNIALRKTKKISNGKGNYKNFSFDDANEKLSFLAEKSGPKDTNKEFKLFYYNPQMDTATVIADNRTKGIPENWEISGNGSISFSQSGNRLFFGTAPIPPKKDTTIVDTEMARLDIWHWQDETIQPAQLRNVNKDRTVSYSAMINPNQPNYVTQLTNPDFNRFTLAEDADNEWAITSTNKEYRQEQMWVGGTRSDIYVKSTWTGETKLVVKELFGPSYLTPKADYVVYYNQQDKNWYSYHIQTETTTLLNQGLEVQFANEDHDTPGLAGSYGIAGWSNDGKSIFLNDRYDIWKISLDGSSRSIITLGYGRANKQILRYIRLKSEENPRMRTTYITESSPIHLSSFNTINKKMGMYILKKKKFQELYNIPYTVKILSIDKMGKNFIYTKEDAQSSPDLYLNKNFKEEIRLTDINPQQAEYNWLTAELVQWTTPTGKPAEGVLYKPEDFNPNKKYPIIAYFYERHTDGFYTYQAPSPTPSRLNLTYFVSNGYLVFTPDIKYETGYPGKSAEEYINSGMKYLSRTYDWVDSTKMGIQGQSWGGYQVAHLITRTDMYAAAWSGAPVVNMTSAYGGIRWGTGISRQFQYENTQSRIGKNLWDGLELYIENSPLFFMNNVTTPTAIMHNDNDGAVPWYQGIEFFLALKRLNKPVWLLNYNGDGHNLNRRQNRKDIQIRQVQFFDHYLKGTPAPNWMKKGVKATEKGIDWGLKIE